MANPTFTASTKIGLLEYIEDGETYAEALDRAFAKEIVIGVYANPCSPDGVCPALPWWAEAVAMEDPSLVYLIV